MKKNPHAHCGFCGMSKLKPFEDTAHFQCGNCDEMTWINPRPVAVAIVRLKDNRGLPSGVLIIQRGEEPAKDGWALPGGFVELGESFVEAAARELQEEVGIVVLTENLRILGDTPTDGCNLVFCETIKPVAEADVWAAFEPHKEVRSVTAVRMRSEIANVCWSTHRDAITKVFDTIGRR